MSTAGFVIVLVLTVIIQRWQMIQQERFYERIVDIYKEDAERWKALTEEAIKERDKVAASYDDFVSYNRN